MTMGIVDVSAQAWPGRPDPDECLRRAQDLVEQGADFLDVTVLPAGPQGKRIDSNDERTRLVPALRKILYRADVPVAVTTYNSATAERVLGLGVAIIADPSGVSLDPEMPRVVNRANAGLILGHSPGPPELWRKGRASVQLIEGILADLDSSVARARRGGIEKRRVVLDPGFGMAKAGPQNYELLERLRNVAKLGRPCLASFSKRPFLVETIRAPDADWRAAEAAVVGLAVRGGAHIIRTSDIETVRAAAYAGDRLLDSLIEPEPPEEEAPKKSPGRYGGG